MAPPTLQCRGQIQDSASLRHLNRPGEYPPPCDVSTSDRNCSGSHRRRRWTQTFASLRVIHRACSVMHDDGSFAFWCNTISSRPTPSVNLFSCIFKFFLRNRETGFNSWANRETLYSSTIQRKFSTAALLSPEVAGPTFSILCKAKANSSNCVAFALSFSGHEPLARPHLEALR